MTETEIEALAVKHEAFGFGRVDAKGYTTHGFDPDGLAAFVMAITEEAVRLEREAIFEEVCKWEDGSFMKLHAGEMSAQEFRTAKAVVVAIRTGYPISLKGGIMTREEMFAWLASVDCNSLTLGRDDDHACNYRTAKEWIEEDSPDNFEDCSPEDIEAMKATNTIWKLQIYPNTPIGFVIWYGPTMESVVGQAMEAWGDVK